MLRQVKRGQCLEDDAGRSHDWNVKCSNGASNTKRSRWIQLKDRRRWKKQLTKARLRTVNCEQAVQKCSWIASQARATPGSALRMACLASTGYRHYEVITYPFRSALWRCGAGRDNKVPAAVAWQLAVEAWNQLPVKVLALGPHATMT